MDKCTSWNCCRTCNSQGYLYDIFSLPMRHEQYTEILRQVTGLKIHINDQLPQQMCKTCIQHINACIDFRHQSQKTHKIFIEHIRHNYKKKLDSVTNDNLEELEILQNNEESNSNFKLESNSYKNVANSEDIDLKKGIFESDIEEILKKKIDLVIEVTKKYEKAELVLSDVKEGEKNKTSERKIICKYCNKEFKSKVILYNHYKIHNGARIVCEHCGLKFTAKRKLLMHCRAKHGYEKVDKCSYCSYRASNPELLKIHERTHTGERPHVCACCGATFHRRSCYLQHAHTHVQHATVPCDECPALFKSVTLMKIHKTKHKLRSKRNTAV